METVADTTFEELNTLFRELKKSHDESVAKRNPESGDPSSEGDASDANFEGLLARLDQILTTIGEDNTTYVKLLSMKSSLLYEQAKVFMSLEELDSSQALLEKALELITNFRDHPQVTFLYMRLINHLAYLLSKKGNFEKSRQLLESILESEEPKNNMLVYSTEELFITQEIDQSQASCKLNKLVANNLQMLGWIYGRLGQHDIHAAKLHMALERQLMAGDSDPVNWACRCSRLAALYLSQCNWISARYHLLAAGSVLDRLERELVIHQDLARAQADLARGWINYGLHLFSNSKAHLLTRRYPGTFHEEAVVEEDLLPKQPDQPVLEFSGFELTTESIPASPVQTTEEARSLFLHTHTWLKRARLYYTLRDFPIHYVNAVLDLSELYRFLAFYECDLDSQYNVQKRRADALETLSAVLREVRPQCYIAVSVELLRELAEVQIEMMGINLRRLHLTGGEEMIDDEHNIKRRISAISNIQLKLESVGNMLGHGCLEDQDLINKEKPSAQPTDTDCEYMNDIIDEAPE